MTDRTITDLDELYQQIQGVKKRGIAYEREENSEFIQCIATPLLKDGVPVFALSIAIPTFRYTEEKRKSGDGTAPDCARKAGSASFDEMRTMAVSFRWQGNGHILRCWKQ